MPGLRAKGSGKPVGPELGGTAIPDREPVVRSGIEHQRHCPEPAIQQAGNPGGQRRHDRANHREIYPPTQQPPEFLGKSRGRKGPRYPKT